MYCEFCGKEIEQGSKYCCFCGNEVVYNVKVQSRAKSLNSKSKEELIKIILRKDKCERSLNSKIQSLIKELDLYRKK